MDHSVHTKSHPSPGLDTAPGTSPSFPPEKVLLLPHLPKSLHPLGSPQCLAPPTPQGPYHGPHPKFKTAEPRFSSSFSYIFEALLLAPQSRAQAYCWVALARSSPWTPRDATAASHVQNVKQKGPVSRARRSPSTPPCTGFQVPGPQDAVHFSASGTERTDTL